MYFIFRVIAGIIGVLMFGDFLVHVFGAPKVIDVHHCWVTLICFSGSQALLFLALPRPYAKESELQALKNQVGDLKTEVNQLIKRCSYSEPGDIF
jgi:hypothetical protein